MIVIIIGVLLSFIVFVAVTKFATWSVYDWFVKEKDLDKFFEKNFLKYGLNPLAKNLFHSRDLPYITDVPFSIFNKWHIEDIGRIGHWSKWSKKLDIRYKELIKEKKSAFYVK